MLQYSSTSVLIVNAEIDMGEVIECIANRTSPCRSAVEKVIEELREEYDVREERKRELEFLEKGGDPLDFEFGNAASVSVQSTSFTYQHPDQLVTSEAKGSFAFTASPHGDSVESSGRPGVPISERNSFDNLLLLDAENELSEGGRNSLHPSRSKNISSEQSSQMDRSRKSPEYGNSASLAPPRKAYKRRYTSRPNRGSHGSSLPSSHDSRDLQRLLINAENQNISSNFIPKTTHTGAAFHKSASADGQHYMELNIVKSVELTEDLTEGVSLHAASDAIASENPVDEQLTQPMLSGAAKTPSQMRSNGPEAVHAMEQMTSEVNECQPGFSSTKVDNESSSWQMNCFRGQRVDEIANDAHNSASHGLKGLDPESFITQTQLSINGNIDGKMSTKMGGVDSNGNIIDQILAPQRNTGEKSVDFSREKKETEGICSTTIVKASACQSQVEIGFAVHPDNEFNQGGSARLDTEIKIIDPLRYNFGAQNEIPFSVRPQESFDSVMSDHPSDDGFLTRGSSVTFGEETCRSNTLQRNIDEDLILKEAEIIEAKRKRIAELSVAISPTETRRKSHWDYMLEEMAWLANDFAQERIWKIAAAAQICCRVTVACRLRKQGNSYDMKVNKVAHTLAKSIMEFWHSVEERSKELEQHNQKDGSVQAYAVRFLKCNNNCVEVPLSPVRISDSGVSDLSWEDNLTEENLFYTIPPAAMEIYRMSIESHLALQEMTGSSVQEEVNTSTCDGVADFEFEDNAYDDGEVSTYGMPSKFGEKKRKYLTHRYGPRPYEIGSDLLPLQCVENKVVTQQSSLLAKRPGSSLNISIPTKRVRTASRRVGGIQVQSKADASSDDTDSFQDDQSTHLISHSLEVQSVRDFEKQLPLYSAGVSTKPKKKKKAKHPNVAYKQRWQVDSSFQHGQFQRDHHLKKRPGSHQLESNDNNGLFGQPMMKKPKMQSQDNSCDIIQPIGLSVRAPVASHMSNTSSPNKFMKMLGDRGRKSKALKMPAGQLGSGIPWSKFEDQALVVLVHDLGSNWELIGDAMNSTFYFKCMFRKSKDCKERHNFLMDRMPGDGADSAEDSQPYPSSLPGIPKGSARQLFQRLQEPVEEGTLKSHFEKIKMLGKKHHHRKTQEILLNQQAHSSHRIALSQVCPNNLNGGGSFLTPHDLCESTTVAGTDILPLGYQGTTSPNQGTVSPILPSSGSGVLHGSSNMMLGNNFSSSPGHLNSSIRDGKYVVPRSDEQQYSHMIPGRNIPQSNISSPGALRGTDGGVRIFPSGNGMGMVCGVNRSMPIARPGLHGIPSVVNSGSMVSPGIAPANMHSGVSTGQGNSMLKPREALHMIRSGLSQDIQMPGNSQGLSSHFTFPNQSGSPIPPVSSYPLHPYSPQSSQVLSPHHHPHFQGSPNHGPTPQQQAYANRLAKERQLQNRFLQQQQLAASNSLMPPHVQSQPQLPISSPMQQNTSQVQPHASSQPVNSLQPKHLTPTQGVVRNAQASGNGLTNQAGKPRQQQQQQFQKANRQHPLQRPNLQAHQQGKVAKGIGRGNIPIEPSLVNGVSKNPVKQYSEKGEPSTHLMQSQGLYASSALHDVQQTIKYVSPQLSNQSVPQQKIYASQNPTHAENSKQGGHITTTVAPSGLPAGHPSFPSSDMAYSKQKQASASRQKLVNQNQPALQKLGRQNSHINSDPLNTQVRDSNSDQNPTSSSSNEKDNTVATLATNAQEGHASEPFVDSNVFSAENYSSLASIPNPDEPVMQTGQVLEQRLSPANLSPNNRHYDGDAQWQQSIPAPASANAVFSAAADTTPSKES